MQKINKLAQASQNSTVHHEASTFGTEALMSKNNNSLKVRLKWYKIDSNDKWFNCWNCRKGAGLTLVPCISVVSFFLTDLFILDLIVLSLF